MRDSSPPQIKLQGAGKGHFVADPFALGHREE